MAIYMTILAANSRLSIEVNEMGANMDRQKVISDWIFATQDTIYLLQMWLGLLEIWQTVGRAEPDDFMDAYQQLEEAALWSWTNQAGGHGIKTLAEAVEVGEEFLEDIQAW
jgi:hypothetical protein